MAKESKYVIRYSELRETYNMCDAIDILVSEAKAESPSPVQSDSGVEEVLKAIHQNTQGPRYWPDIKLALDEYASLKTKELREALEEIIEAGEDFEWGKEFWAVKIATKALNNSQ